MSDVNDTACLLLQAYNDQRDVLILTDEYIRGEVLRTMERVVGYINNYLCMNTNVICIDDHDLASMVDEDDLVITVGRRVSKSFIEKRGAHYAEMDLDDLHMLPYVVPEYNNAQTYQAIAC